MLLPLWFHVEKFITLTKPLPHYHSVMHALAGADWDLKENEDVVPFHLLRAMQSTDELASDETIPDVWVTIKEANDVKA